jgi:hypothetical protein
MARTSNTPQLGHVQEFFLNLYADVAFDLHVYCEVVGAQKTKLINRGVRELIDRDLDENRGFRQRFDALKAQRIEEERRRNLPGGAGLRVIKPQPPSSPTRQRRRRKHDQ